MGINMKTYVYHPTGTCSRVMKITYENNRIVDLEVVGGCSGNLQGIKSLLIGMDFDEVEKRLSGIKCGMKPTSCPDQIAKAIHEIKENELK